MDYMSQFSIDLHANKIDNQAMLLNIARLSGMGRFSVLTQDIR